MVHFTDLPFFSKFEQKKLRIMVVTITSNSTKEEIEEALKLLDRNAPKPRYSSDEEFDAYKFCGALKLREDPPELQKRWRDEW